MRSIIRGLLHLIANWLLNAVGIWVCSAWMDGVELIVDGSVPEYILALELGLALTLMNALLRPILLNLLLPINGLTVGIFSLAVNGFFIILLSRFSAVLEVDGFWVGFLATFELAFINMALQVLIPIDDDIMDYSVIVRRVVNRKRADDEPKGIVMLEIDGLSFTRLKKAVKTGHMPFVKELLESGKYSVRPYDCGVPSQTSSCQAGIMYGRNENICAFRWYNKAEHRVFSSTRSGDASDMEKRLFADSTPRGILDNGLSINNIISGNAEENIFTVSQVSPKSAEDLKQRNRDLYHLSVRPYLLTKSLILTFIDAGSDILTYVWDYISRKKPRLNRIKRFYPLVRGAANILLRDISTAMIVDAVSVGREAMYTTFLGYDEIAHHSGPDSREAYNALSGIDRSIRKVFEAVDLTEARRYEIVILSDHGQSFGPTFAQRYGLTLGDYIKSLAVKYSRIRKEQKVLSIGDDEDNSANVIAVLDGLGTGKSDSLPGKTIKNLKVRISSPEAEEALSAAENEANDILVLASGNLVNTYFPVRDERLIYGEIEELYPGMISELVSHPGVGVVLVHSAEGPLAIGENGSRNLDTGLVTAEDPLTMYGDPEKRSEQLRYLLDFPDAGDLVIISPVYEDGTVAAYEELIGSHGGLGGQQTEPFLMHSAEVQADDDIRNSKQVYDVLQRIRQAPLPKAETMPMERTPETTSVKALWSQIKDTGHWVPVLLRTLYFSPWAYRTVVQDPAFNGPALLIQVFTFLCSWTAMNKNFSYQHDPLVNFGLLVLTYGVEILAAYMAVLILRGKRNPWKLTRAAFFGSYWGIFGILILSQHAVPAWLLIIMVLRVNVLAVSAYTAGGLGPKRALPLFVILILMIPILAADLLMIGRFILYASHNISALG